MLYRNLFTIGLVLSVFLFPWWLTAIMAISGLMLFNAYLEGIFPFIFFDLAYGLALPGWPDWSFMLTVGALVILVVVEYFKKHIIVYN